ncbi:MAG: hypothetical protein IPM02_06155 [Betaproteobacteria bacterium]|nr:hypothetical protein [Betaproteobacteria bacterium]
MKLGIPAVVVNTEQFNRLAKSVMSSQRVPETIAIEIMGNPEWVSAEALEAIAADVTAKVVERLTRQHYMK